MFQILNSTKRGNIFFPYSQHPSEIIQNFRWGYLIQYTMRGNEEGV